MSWRSSNTIPTSARCSTRIFLHMKETFSSIFPAIMNYLLPTITSNGLFTHLLTHYIICLMCCARENIPTKTNKAQRRADFSLSLLIQPLLVTWNYWLSLLLLCCRAALPLRHPLLLWLQFESACGSPHFFFVVKPPTGDPKQEQLR